MSNDVPDPNWFEVVVLLIVVGIILWNIKGG